MSISKASNYIKTYESLHEIFIKFHNSFDMNNKATIKDNNNYRIHDIELNGCCINFKVFDFNLNFKFEVVQENDTIEGFIRLTRVINENEFITLLSLKFDTSGQIFIKDGKINRKYDYNDHNLYERYLFIAIVIKLFESFNKDSLSTTP